jgi:hypothetical protein
MKPVAIVNALWEVAATKIEEPQLAIVIVSDQKTCAFRHNCAAGLPAMIDALRQFADQLEQGDARNLLTDVSKGKES